MAKPLESPRPRSDLHEADFFAWTQDQAQKLRRRAHLDIDWETLAEEIESVGRSEKREILSRLGVLLLHLMKIRYQPDKRKGGWEASVKLQRSKLKKLLSESPSLRHLPAEELQSEYRDAILEAVIETGLPESTFPETCPFTIDEILDDGFFGS